MVSAVSASSPLPTPSELRKNNPSAAVSFGPLQAGVWPSSAGAAALTLPFPWLHETESATAPPEKRRTAEVNEKLADTSTHDEVLAHGQASAIEARHSQDRAAADRSQAEFGERRAAFRQVMRDVQQERAASASGAKPVATGESAGADVALADDSRNTSGQTDSAAMKDSGASADVDSPARPATPRSGASEARTQADLPVNDGRGAGRSASGPEMSAGMGVNRAATTSGESGDGGSGASASGGSQPAGAIGSAGVVAGSGAAGAGGPQSGGAGGGPMAGSARGDSMVVAGSGAGAGAGTGPERAGRSQNKGAGTDAGGTAGAQGGEADGEISPQRVRIESLMRVLKAQIHRRDSSAVMRLDPAELGPLRVQLQWSDSSVAVTLESGSDVAHELLTEQVDSLRDGLERAGLTVERIEVKRVAETPAQSSMSDRQQNPAQERHAAGQDATPQQQRARHARTEADGGGARHASAAEPRDVRQVAAGSSRLNLWA